MDANGTRFHLLLGKDDWASCSAEEGGLPLRDLWTDVSPPYEDPGLEWDADRAELILRRQVFRFSAPTDEARVGSPPGVLAPHPLLERRRGAGRDRYGSWYWIDETRQTLRVSSAGTGQATLFWKPGDGLDCAGRPRYGEFAPAAPATASPPPTLSGLAVTDDHYLVVGVLEPAGLFIFDLHAGGPPQQMFWPKQIPFAPFDMAPAPGGGVWILDRLNRRYWALDRRFQVLDVHEGAVEVSAENTEAFQPADGSSAPPTPARSFPGGIELQMSSPLEAHDPIAIEALPDGTVLILDRNPVPFFSTIQRYEFGTLRGEVSAEVMRALVEESDRAGFQLIAHDLAFVAEHETPEGTVCDRLYLTAEDGNQTFAFKLSQVNGELRLDPRDDYLPMRLFGGRGLVRAGKGVYYDSGERWLPLVRQRRPRYALEATLFTPLAVPSESGSPPGSPPGTRRQYSWDGREPDCVWHRIMLDACIPPETAVEIWSRAANDERAVTDEPWRREPPLHARADGSEQPYVRALPAYRTWELLLQQARGRYLQLQLRLRGSGRSSPRLRALRAYYPRFSYLERYLPAVYRRNPESGSFLDRFLANLEGTHTALEDKIAAVQVLFDPRSAPAETLAWLAGWFGVALDPAWDEARQRLFIRHIMTFFQFRGTIRGLETALRLAHDRCADETLFTAPDQAVRPHAIRIVERFRTRRTPGVLWGDPNDMPRPSAAVPGQRWRPTDGAAELHRRYRQALGLAADAEFPVRRPADSAVADSAAAWETFARQELGFVPSANVALEPFWQQFLARRYRRIAALNSAYGLSGADALAGFDEAELPARLPAEGAPLLDWYQFESVVLPMRGAAHRFTVLLPVPPGDAADRAEQQRRLELTRRIVNWEKPAHTVFDVKFYWAFFRLGEARLGVDSVLDRGSRAPELLPPMRLGGGYLSEGYLAPSHPQDVMDRHILGRNTLVPL